MKIALFMSGIAAFVLLGAGGAAAAPKISANYKGEVIVGNSGLSCSSGTAGAMHYNSATFKMEMCDGTAWTSLAASNGGQAPAAALGNGYFVLSSGSWNGNMGGLVGADAKCLTDLTNNNWKNKSTASANGQLVAAKVKSFLCNQSGSCNNLTPLARYFFALSGDTSAGGAYFDTDSNGYGPNNSYGWTASNYFNGTATYWTGRYAGTATSWSGTAEDACSSWIDSVNYHDGVAANASATDGGRWISNRPNCDSTLKIICMVNP